MIIEAKEVDGIIYPKMEIDLQCSNCGMAVDAVEYTQQICSDCGQPWDPVQHVSIHATSVPASGQST
jgi:rRNA maturation endonuclease Nob1